MATTRLALKCLTTPWNPERLNACRHPHWQRGSWISGFCRALRRNTAHVPLPSNVNCRYNFCGPIQSCQCSLLLLFLLLFLILFAKEPDHPGLIYARVRKLPHIISMVLLTAGEKKKKSQLNVPSRIICKMKVNNIDTSSFLQASDPSNAVAQVVLPAGTGWPHCTGHIQ